MAKITEEYNLKTLYPEIIKEWDYEKNEILPENVAPKSGKKVWWICSNKHRWKAEIKDRHKYGCPYCAGQKATEENNLEKSNPPFLNEWNYYKNQFVPKNYLPKSNKKVWWICKKGHEWKSAIYMRYKRSCPFCSGRRATEENNITNFPEIIKDWDYNKNNIDPKEITPKSHKKVWWKCEKGHSWIATVGSRHIANCPHCSKRISIAGEEWLNNIGLNQNEREVLIKIGKNKFHVDGFKNNIVYEYLGSYWHGDPRLYHPNNKNSNTKTSFGKLLIKTIERLNKIVNNFNIIYMWENEGVEKEYSYIEKSKKEIISIAKNIFKRDLDILEILKEM